ARADAGLLGQQHGQAAGDEVAHGEGERLLGIERRGIRLGLGAGALAPRAALTRPRLAALGTPLRSRSLSALGAPLGTLGAPSLSQHGERERIGGGRGPAGTSRRDRAVVCVALGGGWPALAGRAAGRRR